MAGQSSDASAQAVRVTDEMVERAARALWEEASRWDLLNKGLQGPLSGYPYERLIELRNYARAALDAALNGDREGA